MYRVYWTENGSVCSQDFENDQMSKALAFSQELRTRKYAGENLSHIVLSAENPDCVGKQGYDVTGPDYDWKKRRI